MDHKITKAQFDADTLEDSINDTDTKGFYPGEEEDMAKRIECERRNWELQTQYTDAEIFAEAARRIYAPLTEQLDGLKRTVDHMNGNISEDRPF